MDISIKDGTIVTANDIFKADIGIVNGKIAALGHEITGIENIDASGKFILPGLIEIHSHLESVFGHTRSIDNYFRGSQAAACGGVTTLLDTVVPRPDENLMQAVKNRKQALNVQLAVDYGLHMRIPEAQENYLEEIPELLHAGVASFEASLYSRELSQVHHDSSLLELMESIGRAGGILMVYCGNQALFEQAAQRYPLSEPNALQHYPELCSPQSEAEAIFRLMAMAHSNPCSLFLCHLSSQEALKQILHHQPPHSRIYRGSDIHYLTHTAEVYLQPNAHNYAVLPPLRSARDLEFLWSGIQAGTIQTLSSNHTAFTQEQKKLGADLSLIPPGFANLELMLPVLYHYGVRSRRIDLMQLVALLSTNPARIFGLPDKGSIAVGKDADLVILNPLQRKIVNSRHLQTESDFCLYEGAELQGCPEITLVRGQIVCDNGTFTGEQGAGQFIARNI